MGDLVELGDVIEIGAPSEPDKDGLVSVTVELTTFETEKYTIQREIKCVGKARLGSHALAAALEELAGLLKKSVT